MDWARVKASMLDELEKIGEISLAGLSPRTVLEKGQPAPPLATSGVEKALGLLDRYTAETQVQKTAAPVVPYNMDLPSINRVTGAKKRKKKKEAPSTIDRGKSFGAHVAGGAGIGRLAGYVAQGSRAAITNAERQAAHSRMWGGTVVGGAVGGAEFARKRIAERVAARREAKAHEKSAAAFASPGIQLKASRQVGAQPNRTTLTGPGPKAVTRKAFGGTP